MQKRLAILAMIMLLSIVGIAQKVFTGVVKYKMSVLGGDEKKADSMRIVFDTNRIMATLYVPSEQKRGTIEEMGILVDFKTHKQYYIDNVGKTYQEQPFGTPRFRFLNTEKIAMSNGAICFHYKADSNGIDKTKMLKADCLASIDHTNAQIGNFWLMDIFPIVIEGKLVLDFIIKEPDGSQPRVYAATINRDENVKAYFDLTGYKLFAE